VCDMVLQPELSEACAFLVPDDERIEEGEEE
jgi:hypothetical protein